MYTWGLNFNHVRASRVNVCPASPRSMVVKGHCFVFLKQSQRLYIYIFLCSFICSSSDAKGILVSKTGDNMDIFGKVKLRVLNPCMSHQFIPCVSKLIFQVSNSVSIFIKWLDNRDPGKEGSWKYLTARLVPNVHILESNALAQSREQITNVSL